MLNRVAGTDSGATKHDFYVHTGPISPIQIKTGAEAPVSISELPLVKLGHSYGDVR